MQSLENALIESGYKVTHSGNTVTVSDPLDVDGFELTGTDKAAVLKESYRHLITDRS